MNDDAVSVCLYSDGNFLSVSLLEILLSKNCFTQIVTDDIAGWEMMTKHLAANNHFAYIRPKDIKKPTYFNYILFCSGFNEKAKTYPDFRIFSENKFLNASKILIVIPFETFDAKEDALIGSDDRLGTIYIGDLIGPRINIGSDLLAPRIIREIFEKGEMSVSTGEIFYPIFIADAAKTIAKWIFSFGPYGKSLFLLGSQTSASDFWRENQKIFGNVKLKYDNIRERRYVPRNYDIKILQCNLGDSLAETFKWFGKSVQTQIVKPSKPREKKLKPIPKRFKFALIGTLLILVSPLIFLFMSIGLSYVSYKNILADKGASAPPVLTVAKTLYSVAGAESKVLKYIPGLGLIYKETEFGSLIGQELVEVGIHSVPLVKIGSTLFESVLGDKIYDPSFYTQELSGGLSTLDMNVNNIISITDGARNSGVLGAKLLAQKIDLERVRKITDQGKIFAEYLPDFLGANERKTYLILFQNNMELRPTGGFIGSFGLLTFDGGRMSDLTVSDVYSADGQLKGHVEPPEPIRDYLGEANWWLRDSNWDPDFPTSAKRAEWFLDKEIDQKVDGVIAIDLNLVKDLLKLTGPVFLADYNMEITSDNIYEKTQAEAEENFFPGSHQKASFLTALSRNLINYTENLEGKGRIYLLSDIFNNLEERHVQIYLHDEALQKPLSEIGWSGEILDPSCGAACYADLVGITEANVGVNKANYFISRDVNLKVNVTRQRVERQLTLEIKNSANGALEHRGKYKSYVRVFIPADSVLMGARSIYGEYTEELKTEIFQSHGRLEAGALVEVLGGTNKKIVFEWATKDNTGLNVDTYGVYIRKQGGVGDDHWTVNITPPSSSLTKTGSYTYNTVLSKDFFARVRLYEER